MFWFRLISHLPLPVLYAFSDILYFMGYRVFGYRREVVRRNLINSFPEKSKAELRKIERAFYRNLCDYPFETLKLLTMKQEEVEKRMKLKNAVAAEKYAKEGRSMIYLTTHNFN